MKMNMNKEWCFLNTLTWKLFIMSDKVDGDVWTYTCTIMFVLLTFWNYYNKFWTWVKYCWKFSIFWIKLLKAFFPVLYENRGKAIQTCARPLIKAHCVSHHSNFNSIQSANIYEIHNYTLLRVCVRARRCVNCGSDTFRFPFPGTKAVAWFWNWDLQYSNPNFFQHKG